MNTKFLTRMMVPLGFAVNLLAGFIPLGTLQPFAVLGSSTVTSTGLTQLDGDLGVYSGTAITGFFGTSTHEGPGTFTGTAYEGSPEAHQAQSDALTAYNTMAALTSTVDLTGQDLGGLTLAPGVYHFNVGAQLTGILTLDGVGDYVFQIGTTLTTAVGASVVYLNGADPFSNVYWQVGTSSTFGASTVFGGTVIADQSQTLGTGTRIDGRVAALNGAVTLDSNIINIPEISSAWMLALVALALIVRSGSQTSV